MNRNHPNRNWRRRMLDVADSKARAIISKRCPDGTADQYDVALMVREAYVDGFEAGRDAGRGKAR